MPHADPEQPLPEMLQVTAVFEVFATVAENCWVFPANTETLSGEMVTDTGNETVTVADADFVVSAFEVAVTVTCAGLGTEAGAV